MPTAPYHCRGVSAAGWGAVWRMSVEMTPQVVGGCSSDASCCGWETELWKRRACPDTKHISARSRTAVQIFASISCVSTASFPSTTAHSLPLFLFLSSPPPVTPLAAPCIPTPRYLVLSYCCTLHRDTFPASAPSLWSQIISLLLFAQAGLILA